MSGIATDCTVNGQPCTVAEPPHRVLLDTLRDALGLTGTKRGCDVGACGACNLIVDGIVRRACLTLTADMDGCAITTIEGLADGITPGLVQRAFVDAGAIQCGFCMPGMIIAATGLLARNATPSVEEVRAGLAGNLCRCSGYTKVIEAVRLAAERGQEGARHGL